MEQDSDARIDNEDIKETLRYLKQVSPFSEDNSSIGSIAKSVITNEVEKMKRKDVYKYSVKCCVKIKTLPTKYLLNLPVKVELLLFLTYYLKG